MVDDERAGGSVAEGPHAAGTARTRSSRSSVWIVWALVIAGGSAAVLLLRMEALDALAEVPRTQHAPLVEVVVARSHSVAVRLSGTSNLIAHKDVTVVSERDGKISEITVDEGDRVEQGARLATLDDRSFRLAVRQAKTELAQAQREHARARTLHDRGIVGTEELERLRSAKELAAQMLERANDELSRSRVVAPFGGRITRRHVEVGQYVTVAEPLLELIDDSVLEAELFVSERDALDLTPGRPVEVQLGADPTVAVEGSIRSVDSVVDVDTGTVRVVVEVRRRAESMRSGSFVRLSLVLRSFDDACLLPREAVQIYARGDARVFTVEDGIARARVVEVGVQEDGQVQIVDGLEPGERVVLVGHADLIDGQRVEVSSLETEGP